ncbi:MAG: hypothetical protein K9W42_01330 [Candidatus Heimdallarchaeota archaeon]|nr:hypothetical protein [Candidatus Heimdallarchaeota archaeon]
MASWGKQCKSFFIIFLIVFLPPLLLNLSQITSQKAPPLPEKITVTPNEGFYAADLNWVKTVIKLEKNGLGKVTILVNCTPEASHKGMYLRPLVENEAVAVVAAETYAINHGNILALNYSSVFSQTTSFLFSLKNRSALYFNETVLYHLTYTADFFLSNQLFHYNNDPDLVSISLERPTWDGTLDYQELEIILPIDVGQQSITAAFLEESRFTIHPNTLNYYQISNATTEEGEHYWFTVLARKDNLDALAPFDATFYLSVNYFSLPRAMNWLVISLVFTLLLLALFLYVLVITIKKESEKEVTSFKEGLYEVLTAEAEEPSE